MIAIIRVTTTGSAGSATGSATSELVVTGYLETIKTTYSGVPSTTDVTITEASGLQRTLLTLTNSNTNSVDNPRYLIQDNAGADVAANYTKIWIDGKITVSVAQADAVTDGVVVRIQLSERGTA